MVPFSLEVPAVIHFGAGSLRKLPEIVAGLGKRVLLVVGRSWLSTSGFEARIISSLAGCTVERISCPASEPTTDALEAAAADAARFAPDIILGIGGGSVLDSSKALSALLRYPGSAERYLEGLEGSVPVPGPCVPWIAVPTTAGTGAEATKNAVIRAPRLGVKRSMRSPHLLARAVVVDPDLTLSLPPRMTGISGLDALTQLVEAYVSRTTTPFVQSLVEGAFPLMIDALRGLSSKPEDSELRSGASYGALVSGIALAHAGLGAAHGFAAAIGVMFNVPHGLACAILLPHVLEANALLIEGQIAKLAASRRQASPGAWAVKWLAAEVWSLINAFGLPVNLREYQIPSASIPELAERSSGSSMRGNPRDIAMAERVEILSRVI
jgi:alcohol dehydrogenase class IV